ncbi:MAG: YheU family protein [Deltaproteobacteria bacterium]|nr:YheU family protein [Deltaproteobacteria bacterium]
MNQLRDNKGVVRVPYDRLSPEILEAVIEEFVTREGTDYGTTDVPFTRKIEQVRRQIETGRALIVFDESMQSCTILQKDDPRLGALDGER